MHSVRIKQMPTCPSQVKFAWGKLKVSAGCPLGNMKFRISARQSEIPEKIVYGLSVGIACSVHMNK